MPPIDTRIDSTDTNSATIEDASPLKAGILEGGTVLKTASRARVNAWLGTALAGAMGATTILAPRDSLADTPNAATSVQIPPAPKLLFGATSIVNDTGCAEGDPAFFKSIFEACLKKRKAAQKPSQETAPFRPKPNKAIGQVGAKNIGVCERGIDQAIRVICDAETWLARHKALHPNIHPEVRVPLREAIEALKTARKNFYTAVAELQRANGGYHREDIPKLIVLKELREKTMKDGILVTLRALQVAEKTVNEALKKK